MQALLALSRAIDALSRAVGRAVMWLTLLVVLISAGNAVARKLFNLSSNAWLEVQWYLFGAIFMLGAGYALLRGDHVRVDILASRWSRRTQLWVEVAGVVFFLLPFALLVMWLAWPMAWGSFLANEQSSNTGGLVRWPVKLLIPVGFGLLALAGVSHLIKCVACLLGLAPDPRLGDSVAEPAAEPLPDGAPAGQPCGAVPVAAKPEGKGQS